MDDLFSRMPKQNYSLKPYTELLRGEQKAYFMKYSDIANLNYKILIDYDKPYGLLAGEDNINSALSYLKSIGEDNRFEMLKIWIENLKVLIKDYEFLFMNVEGLDVMQNMKFGHFPTIDSRVNFNLRDTVDLRIQALITTYKTIVFDSVRHVEVLPINLRRFDMSIVVFVAGYYNMLLYDDLGHDEAEIERLIFPTIRKLSDEHFNFRNLSNFNNVIYDLYDCEIMLDETGKTGISEVSNESLEMLRNNLNINYRFFNINGNFNNNYGHSNYGNFLSVLSEMHKNQTTTDENNPFIKTFLNNIGDRIKDKFIELSNPNNYIEAGRQIISDTTDLALTKLNNVEKMVFGKVVKTGEFWDKISVDYARQMVQNTINVTVNNLEDRLVRDPLTRLNNMLTTNYNHSLYDVFKSESPNSNIDYSPNIPNVNSTNSSQNIANNIKYENVNIYKRNGL